MSARRGVALLVRCYPRAWRERYGDELADLVATSGRGGRIPMRVYADVVRGAARERVRAASGAAGGGADAPVRAGIALTLWAWALFVLAGVAAQKHAEHWQDAGTGSHVVPTVAFGVLVAGAAVAGMLVLAGIVAALPGAVALLRSDGGHAVLRRRVRAAGAFSAAAAVTLPAIVGWAHGLGAPARNGADHAYVAAVTCWSLLAAAALLSWTSVAVAIARHATLGAATLRLEARLASVVVTGMAAMTAATATWQGTTGFGSAGEGVAICALMLGATVLGAAGARRAAHASAG